MELVRTGQQKKNVRVLQVTANGVTDVVSQIPNVVSQIPDVVSYLPQALPEGLSNVQGWDGEKLGLSAAGLVYLTAKPGVLLAALDSFIAAPFQTVIEFVRGRRSWKRSDFVVDERLGEGSFGTVYTGVILPKNLSDDDDELVGRRGRRLEEFDDYKKFKKVVLKKVRLGFSLLNLVNRNPTFSLYQLNEEPQGHSASMWRFIYL